MVGAGVHHQDLGSSVRFLDHVGQVMAIVLGQAGAEDDEIEGIAAQSFLNRMAVEYRGDVMASSAHFGGVGGESGFVGLTIENLDGWFLSSRGQKGLLELSRSLPTGEHPSEITEEQGPVGVYWAANWAAAC
jgi:hypothetical protein